MKFYFSGVDVELSFTEMILTVLSGIAIVTMPFIVKGLLLWIL